GCGTKSSETSRNRATAYHANKIEARVSAVRSGSGRSRTKPGTRRGASLGATPSETLVDGTFTALMSPFAPDLGPPELDNLPLDAFSSRPHPLDTPEDLPKWIRRQATLGPPSDGVSVDSSARSRERRSVRPPAGRIDRGWILDRMRAVTRHRASGSGRSWNFTTLLVVPLP